MRTLKDSKQANYLDMATQVLELFDHGTNWIKGSMAQNTEGFARSTSDADAAKFCLAGGLEHIAYLWQKENGGNLDILEEPIRSIWSTLQADMQDYLGSSDLNLNKSITQFNDYPEQGFFGIQLAIEKAWLNQYQPITTQEIT